MLTKSGISRFIAIISIAFLFGLNVNINASCPPIPDCWEPFVQAINPQTGTEWFHWIDSATGCEYAFTFCYRSACNEEFIDVVIGEEIISLDPNCVSPNFDPDQFKDIVQGCLGMAVTEIEAQQLLNAVKVPNCEEGWSPSIFRYGKIVCTSEWYRAWWIPQEEHMIQFLLEKLLLVKQVLDVEM